MKNYKFIFSTIIKINVSHSRNIIDDYETKSHSNYKLINPNLFNNIYNFIKFNNQNNNFIKLSKYNRNIKRNKKTTNK